MRVREEAVRIPPAGISGDLGLPDGAKGLVLFAHGSGSGRFSSRNRFVAEVLRESGLSTLLLDLLTSREEALDARTKELRFDIGLLAQRLIQATEWVRSYPETVRMRLGYFGASTGGGAALVAAANLPDVVQAVVSRGGRPDLASPALPRVKAATLLIVGQRDYEVKELNETALKQLRCEAVLEIVPNATHLFEEPGALGRVSELASNWFIQHLTESH